MMDYSVAVEDTPDARALAALHGASMGDGGEAWSISAWGDLLNMAGAAVVVCLNDGDVLQGLALVRMAGGEAELLTMAVHPSVRRCGMARALVVFAQAHTAQLGHGQMFLEVRADNAPAIALYESCGFLKAGVRRDYYKTTKGRVDAWVMNAA